MVFNFQEQVELKSNDELLKIYTDYDQYQDDYIDMVSKELDKRKVDFSNLKLRRQHKEAFIAEQLEKGKPGDPIFYYFRICLCFVWWFNRDCCRLRLLQIKK